MYFGRIGCLAALLSIAGLHGFCDAWGGRVRLDCRSTATVDSRQSKRASIFARRINSRALQGQILLDKLSGVIVSAIHFHL